jgi:squalene-hopene/tetraprenyl-beta-curcumene cyclase
MRSSRWDTSALRDRLLAERTVAGHWEGELSSSPLSTATAVSALTLVGGHDTLVRNGLRWLAMHQNDDGGFGDATGCPSNISTTTLAWATLGMHQATGLDAADAWLVSRVGPLTAESLAGAISDVYGDDQTFAVPILTHCALAGRFGWEHIPALPFEVAALPHSWFKWIGLPVVSYALPALIAIGQAQHHHYPASLSAARAVRNLTQARTLRVLESIQPTSGGFLEATPLTSFVTMSLAGSGLDDHPVTRLGVDFLTASVRDDGSWPIDTNLATWVTTLSINALGADAFTPEERQYLRRWLLDQQYTEVHPYTQSPPGGWAWTDLPGGVPDADDTSGALLALAVLGEAPETRAAATSGVGWLIDLQNRDGGIPTFCRGWGHLPFDQSSPDLTAHALRAWRAWHTVDPRIDRAMERAVRYLVDCQREDGAWIPLWFGNPWTDDQTNPVYGTARVLECGDLLPASVRRRGEQFLASMQQEDGSFGTIEETALAVAVSGDERGARWLESRTELTPAPIGLYFAKLWYFEKLYPLIFTVSALTGRGAP